MDYVTYRKSCFTDPRPVPRFDFTGTFGVTLYYEEFELADRLQAAFIAAGGAGPEPTDTLMYEPVRYCPVRDPFGTDLLIISPRSAS
jgi:hypothetical protein